VLSKLGSLDERGSDAARQNHLQLAGSPQPVGGCTDGVRVGAIETGDMIASLGANSARLIAGAALAGVVGSLALAAGGHHQAANWLWAATTAMLLVPLTWSVLRSLLRGDVGVDAIAFMSMAGALALREYLAGAVVALMLAGGNALEEAANRRARHELTKLVERAPRSALVRRGDELVELPIDDVGADEIVLVRAGEVAPGGRDGDA
jgi:cation transport ATPase